MLTHYPALSLESLGCNSPRTCLSSSLESWGTCTNCLLHFWQTLRNHSWYEWMKLDYYSWSYGIAVGYQKGVTYNLRGLSSGWVPIIFDNTEACPTQRDPMSFPTSPWPPWWQRAGPSLISPAPWMSCLGEYLERNGSQTWLADLEPPEMGPGNLPV